MKCNRSGLFSLAFCVAFLPPVWAVIAPHINIETGAVALICTGLYAARGNKREDAIKITIGFLLGDLWSVLALKFMNIINWQQDVELFLTLFIMGGLAVLISGIFSKWIFTPSWLCGWAIGLTILNTVEMDKIFLYVWQIAVSMVVGVWYVGVCLDIIQKKLWKRFGKRVRKK